MQHAANDAPFVARIVAQSLLSGVPPDLSQEAQNVLAEMRAVVPSVVESLSITSNEQCPACQTEISLQDITNAVCLNGHTWGNVSFIHSDIYVLTVRHF
jgi:general transcription factor 3C protein 4